MTLRARAVAVALAVTVTVVATGCSSATLPDASRSNTAAAAAPAAVEPAAPATTGTSLSPTEPGAAQNPATGDVLYANGGGSSDTGTDTATGPGQVVVLGDADQTATNGQVNTGSLAPSSSFYEAAAADPSRQPGATHAPWAPSNRPTAPTSGATDADVVALIHQYFPREEWGRAAAIASCESGMRSVTSAPNRNGTRDWGVFQFNDGGTLQSMLRRTGHPDTDLQRALDPAWNVQAAAIYHAGRGPGGWSPWSCAHRLGIVASLWSPVPGPKANDY